MRLKIIKELYKIFYHDSRGNILLFAMIFGTISMTIIIVGVAGYAISENKASLKKHNREMAFQIADAGVNYYRWHLAHDNFDYYDGNGTSTPGPYVHDYKDKDGNIIGHFSLDITPPPVGSSIVTVQSTGWLDIQPGSQKIYHQRHTLHCAYLCYEQRFAGSHRGHCYHGIGCHRRRYYRTAATRYSQWPAGAI